MEIREDELKAILWSMTMVQRAIEVKRTES